MESEEDIVKRLQSASRMGVEQPRLEPSYEASARGRRWGLWTQKVFRS